MSFNFNTNFGCYLDKNGFEAMVDEESQDKELELTEFVNSLLADDEVPTVSNDVQLQNVTVISNAEINYSIQESSKILEASVNEVDSSKDQSTQKNKKARSKGRPGNFMEGLNYGIAREIAVQNSKNISIPEKAIEPKQDAVHLEPKKKRKGSEMAEPSRKMPRKLYSGLETYLSQQLSSPFSGPYTFNESKQIPISDLITQMNQISKKKSLETTENVGEKKRRGKPRQTALFNALAEKRKESEKKLIN
jgi:hypothetical protein